MRTPAAPVEGTEVRVEPAEEPGITINGTPVGLESVVKADVRVDLAAGRSRSFVVEHVLGPLGLCGVTAATVTGLREAWSFDRPEHRFCYSTDLRPRHVVGHPAGLPNPALAAAIRETGVVGPGPETRRTVAEPLTHAANGGELRLTPRAFGAGVRFEVTLAGAEFEATVDPAGDNDPELVDAVTNATTPYLAPDDEAAVTHAIADLVSDVAVIGGLHDVFVEADLGDAYHALTVGAARAAHDRGLVEERSA